MSQSLVLWMVIADNVSHLFIGLMILMLVAGIVAAVILIEENKRRQNTVWTDQVVGYYKKGIIAVVLLLAISIALPSTKQVESIYPTEKKTIKIVTLTTKELADEYKIRGRLRALYCEDVVKGGNNGR